MLHTDDIWAELTRRRIRAKDIASDLGVATSTVTRAINGETRTPAPTILADVAARIGVEVENLSPGRPSHRTSEDTGKPSHRSTSKGEPVQTSGRPSKVRSQSKSKAKARGDAYSTPKEDAPNGKEMAA